MTERARIAVCDDEPGLREMLEEYLCKQGYGVRTAADGVALRRLVPTWRPDIVILDINMPGEDGLSLARWLRVEEHCAILMLTAAGQPEDRIVGLEVGADDYLAKPFDLAELRARIRAILRRTMAPAVQHGRPNGRMRVGRCIVDLEQRKLYDESGEAVALTSMEFDLLHVLVSHARRALSREKLLELAHHKRWDPFDRSIDIRIGRLRKKIEPDPSKPSVLRTVRGEGYMLVPEGE
jgi:DNA-binding response OmpR family regulator